MTKCSKRTGSESIVFVIGTFLFMSLFRIDPFGMLRTCFEFRISDRKKKEVFVHSLDRLRKKVGAMEEVIPIVSMQFVGGILGAILGGIVVAVILFWLYTSRN